jgi:hypothetical protein
MLPRGREDRDSATLEIVAGFDLRTSELLGVGIGRGGLGL